VTIESLLKPKDLLALFLKNLVSFNLDQKSRPQIEDASEPPFPSALLPLQLGNCVIQVLVDHGFIAQKFVKLLSRRQE